MATKYILAGLSVAFFVAALVRRGEAARLQRRAWLIIAAVFAAVSGWLWLGA